MEELGSNFELGAWRKTQHEKLGEDRFMNRSTVDELSNPFPSESSQKSVDKPVAQVLPQTIQKNLTHDSRQYSSLSPNLQGTVKSLVPDGSGAVKFRAPNIDSFVFDRSSGYRFDPSTGLHYDANSGLFVNLALGKCLRWDQSANTYLPEENIRTPIPAQNLPSLRVIPQTLDRLAGNRELEISLPLGTVADKSRVQLGIFPTSVAPGFHPFPNPPALSTPLNPPGLFSNAQVPDLLKIMEEASDDSVLDKIKKQRELLAKEIRSSIDARASPETETETSSSEDESQSDDVSDTRKKIVKQPVEDCRSRSRSKSRKRRVERSRKRGSRSERRRSVGRSSEGLSQSRGTSRNSPTTSQGNEKRHSKRSSDDRSSPHASRWGDVRKRSRSPRVSEEGDRRIRKKSGSGDRLTSESHRSRNIRNKRSSRSSDRMRQGSRRSHSRSPHGQYSRARGTRLSESSGGKYCGSRSRKRSPSWSRRRDQTKHSRDRHDSERHNSLIHRGDLREKLIVERRKSSVSRRFHEEHATLESSVHERHPASYSHRADGHVNDLRSRIGGSRRNTQASNSSAEDTHRRRQERSTAEHNQRPSGNRSPVNTSSVGLGRHGEISVNSKKLDDEHQTGTSSSTAEVPSGQERSNSKERERSGSQSRSNSPDGNSQSHNKTNEDANVESENCDSGSEFDFLKDALDEDQESVVFDEYEEVLEYGDMYESKLEDTRHTSEPINENTCAESLTENPNPVSPTDNTPTHGLIKLDKLIDDNWRLLFIDDTPTDVVIVGPIQSDANSKKPKYLLLEATFVNLKALLDKEGTCYTGIHQHVDANVGAPFSYITVKFSDSANAECWFKEHNRTLEIGIEEGDLLKNSEVEQRLLKVNLHYAESDWKCSGCQYFNFHLRSFCHCCFLHKDERQWSPIVKTVNQTTWVATSKSVNWTSDDDLIAADFKALLKAYHVVSVKVLRDPKCRFFPQGCLIQAKTKGEGLRILELLQRSKFRSSFVSTTQELQNFVVTSAGNQVEIMNDNLGSANEAECANSTPNSMISVPGKIENTIVCADYDTVTWIHFHGSLLDHQSPPTKSVMITPCPGSDDLPMAAKAQIQKSLELAGVSSMAINFCLGKHFGSPFSYCLVNFSLSESAKTWFDKCEGKFEFSVPCPADPTEPLNILNCYSQCDVSSGPSKYAIKSQLHFTSSNWLCSCGATNISLRSYCHQCYSRGNTTGAISAASNWLGIKLSKYDGQSIISLRDHQLFGFTVKRAELFLDPSLPQDPCGLVILEMNFATAATELRDTLMKPKTEWLDSPLKELLDEASEVIFLSSRFVQSIEPAQSKDWDVWFTDETVTSIVALPGLKPDEAAKVKLCLKQDGLTLEHFQEGVTGLPDYGLIHFPDCQSSKTWFDAHQGTNPLLTRLCFTNDVWTCGACQAPNAPVRVLCHNCFLSKNGEGVPFKRVVTPQKWVGVGGGLLGKKAQQRAMSVLNNERREESANFQLKGLRIFADPKVNSVDYCCFVFEVSSDDEAVHLTNFLKKYDVPSNFMARGSQEG